MGISLLIDFGSTYTKITAVDLEREEVVGRTQAASTVATDMTIGLHRAFRQLFCETSYKERDIERKLACSSAAGGLRLVVVGLVPRLTSQAANSAALGAGAKVVGVYSYDITPAEVREIEAKSPDLLLLVGGTDGGDKDVIISNAEKLAVSKLACPFIVAGNKAAAFEVEARLKAGGKEVTITENVMPEIGCLNVEPVRSLIREIFMHRIVHAKGLDKAQEFVGSILMPTPMAVLKGAVLLAKGTPEEPGIGELVVIDVGGATTDVHSVAAGAPSQADVVPRGLPEPYAKRTVEGDLGIRYNAPYILERVGKQGVTESIPQQYANLLQDIDLELAVRYLADHIDAVPKTQTDFAVDAALSRSAISMAMDRHAGVLEPLRSPAGTAYLQRGKDLSEVRCLIGTGGIFAYGREQRFLLEGARWTDRNPLSLRPKAPELWIDELYILYAIGLLSEVAPSSALRTMKKHLTRV